jgi:tetratricopeptide (TPR) repeat protein
MVPRDAGSTAFAEGLPYLERAVSIHEASGANVFLSRMYWMWADGLLLAGDTEEAIEKTRHALALSGAFGERGVEAEASLLLADIEATSDQLVAAASHYSYAIAIGEELAMRPLLAHWHAGFARLHHRTGHLAKALEQFGTATRMYREMGMTYWLEQAEAEMRGLG